MEAKRTAKLMQYLKQHNAFVIVLGGGNVRQQAGLPDRIVSHKNLPHVVFLEFKDGYRPLEKLQAYVIDNLNKRNPNSAFVVRFIGEDDLIIEDHLAMVLGKCKTNTFIGVLARLCINQ